MKSSKLIHWWCLGDGNIHSLVGNDRSDLHQVCSRHPHSHPRGHPHLEEMLEGGGGGEAAAGIIERDTDRERCVGHLVILVWYMLNHVWSQNEKKIRSALHVILWWRSTAAKEWKEAHMTLPCLTVRVDDSSSEELMNYQRQLRWDRTWKELDCLLLVLVFLLERKWIVFDLLLALLTFFNFTLIGLRQGRLMYL